MHTPPQIPPDEWDRLREEFIRDEPGDVDAMWARFSSSVSNTQPARVNSTPRTTPNTALNSTPIRRVSWRPIATGLAGAAAIAVMGIFGYRAWTENSADRPAMVYSSSAMEVRHLTLPDSTRVVLAPNSRLKYEARRHGASLAHLTGQAYFTVTHQSSRSFTVQANGVETRVLGTAFQVTAYPDEQGAQVAVASGKVSVQRSASQQSIILTPGMMASVADSMTITRDANISATIAWIDDRLVFDEAKVPEVLEILGRWYGYQFRLADSTLASRKVTTEFRTQDPRKMLVVLRELLEVTMTVDDSVITLRPQTPQKKMTAPPSRRLDFSQRSLEVGK